MLRLTLLLCGGMLLALIFWGEDRGQMRPGLARGARDAALAAPEAPPRVLAAAPETATDPAPVEPEATPDVEPGREPVAAFKEPVFSLANVGNESVPEEEYTALDAPETVADATQSPDGTTVWYVTAASVNLRAEPSTDADILTKLFRGEAAVLVAEVDAGWAQIFVQSDGLVGYVAMRYLGQIAP